MTGSSATLLLARCGAADIVAVAHYPFHALEVRVKTIVRKSNQGPRGWPWGHLCFHCAEGQQAAPLQFGVC